MPLNSQIKKTLVIGSGPIVIGQAAEFDYAGAQACRVLKQAGINVVLANSNPATIMTDRALADQIYLEPLTAETIRRIIELERPDSLLAGLGGQTGLTIAMQLSRDGFLERNGVRLLGTDAAAIAKAEDRELFKQTMDALGQPTIPSGIAHDPEQACAIAERIGYPVIVRPAFTLGGAGGGVADTAEELRLIAATGVDLSPIGQILVEKYIFGWKEIEFEAMRDSLGNAIAICSMENVDPVGVHTGDSIVVAPALTLSDKEYQMLRGASLAIVEALGIVGGCNCQFALDPESFDYAVIEVNPRVSRSSALASKATGYPIAKITTQLALGYSLDELTNEVTGQTCACFEPAIDYVVVKFPKWPFDKFVGSSRALGTQMKATGEVMAIATSFEQALLKAVRGAEISLDTLNAPPLSDQPLRERLAAADDRRLFTIFEALKSGLTVDEIYAITRIDRWFLYKLQRLARFEQELAAKGFGEAAAEKYREAKQLGYTDAALRRLSGQEQLPGELHASYRMVDTCGAEFAAQTPYFYAGYDGGCEVGAFRHSDKEAILVLGSGPIRIGQGIEFDYSSVHCVWALKQLGYDVAIVNNNPETVSTDYDTADRLYFEPLTEEDVFDVIQAEQPIGVVVAFGGQTAIKLTQALSRAGVNILGTSAAGIDLAEDRDRFDRLLERFSIRRPQGRGVTNLEQALAAAHELGYPLLLRPSYVIGGQNMMIVHSDEEVRLYLERILRQQVDAPVLVDKYMPGTELEVDVISDGVEVLIPGVMEHIERAGVHSGDSIAVYPPYNLPDKLLQTVVERSRQLALALGTRGLVNIQYLIHQGELYVIEVNPRASRTVPYISKVTGVPMVELAARVMVGQPLSELGYGVGLYPAPPYYAVKAPVFSFEKLSDANSYLGPEMKSTGEVLGIGKTLSEAMFKALTSSGLALRAPAWGRDVGVLLSVDEHDHKEMVALTKSLDDLGFKLYATAGTARAIEQLGVDVTEVPGLPEGDDIFRLMEEGRVSYIVYTGAAYDATMDDYIALHRRALQLSIVCLTSLDTANAVAGIIASGYNQRNTELVDLNHMRSRRQPLSFAKMQGSGSDYIFIENLNQEITCPESLCITLCDRHYGVGGDGLVLIERSSVADARMRIFTRDGSPGRMQGNSIRCVGKYLYDKGLIHRDTCTIETESGLRRLELHLRNDRVSSVTVDMGQPDLSPAAIPVRLSGSRMVGRPVTVGGENYRVTCVSLGSPHCVLFCDQVDRVDVAGVGQAFEHDPLFPQGVTTDFIRVVHKNMIKMRVWELGSGETLACGAGACAAVVAAVEQGLCAKGEDVVVKTRGGDLVVNYSEAGLLLTGDAALLFQGVTEY